MTPDDVTPDEHRPTMDDEYPSGYSGLFWAGLLVGWAVIAIGIRGLLVNEDARMGTNPGGWVVLLVQSNLAHDLILVPAVLLVGVLVARFVPAEVRAPVQGGLIVTGVIVLFAFPFVRGYGIKPDNPTILPQDYGRGLIIVLGVVWAVTAAVTIGRRRSHRASSAAPAKG